MQTFLPYKSFAKTARVLDKTRLGKQRVEASQILDLVEGRADNTWKYHPAVRMWQGYADALRLYYNTMLAEWEDRGCENNMPYLPILERIRRWGIPDGSGSDHWHDCRDSGAVFCQPVPPKV